MSPNCTTPWKTINQLLACDERYNTPQGFLLVPKTSSQLSALLFTLNDQNIPFSLQGKGTTNLKLSQPVILSMRAFSEVIFLKEGVVEIGAGCSLSQLQSTLFEEKQEIILSGDPFLSAKRSIGGAMLGGRIAGYQLRGESIHAALLGIELMTFEGALLKWGGAACSALPGPSLHKLIFGLDDFPAVLTKIILKTYPLPSMRLRIAWSFYSQEDLWRHLLTLQSFCCSWECLDCVLSGESSEKGYVLAQVSGSSEEMEAFKKYCPNYHQACDENEWFNIKSYFNSLSLNSYLTTSTQTLITGEYLWMHNLDNKAWWLTPRRMEENEKKPFPVWKQHLYSTLNVDKQCMKKI